MLYNPALELTSQVLTHVFQQNITHSHSSKALLPSRAINTVSRSMVLEPNPSNSLGRNNTAISELRREQHAAAADASLPKNATPPSEGLCDIALGKADFSTVKICDNALIMSLANKCRVQRWISTLKTIQGSSRRLSPRIWFWVRVLKTVQNK